MAPSEVEVKIAAADGSIHLCDVSFTEKGQKAPGLQPGDEWPSPHCRFLARVREEVGRHFAPHQSKHAVSRVPWSIVPTGKSVNVFWTGCAALESGCF